MTLSDKKLVSQTLQGDQDAYAQLVDRYKKQIYNLMYRHTNSADDAAEMTQDIFCKAYERLNTYQHEKSFFSWLYTMALNMTRDRKRKQNYHYERMNQISHEMEKSSPSPSKQIESSEQTEHLWRALDHLSDNRKEMVILRYRHDHSIQDLAEIFNLSESAIKMRLHRALADLNVILKSESYA